ncbi:MAG: transglutaminase-like domain-containing protein [Candidatus Diapherotrites archaeon]|nr:transglutaminase-like domain-containing protein [Candidatus Diapherotrites archaeon]
MKNKIRLLSKVLLVFILFTFIQQNCFCLDTYIENIKSLDVNVTQRIIGKISGEVSRGDEIEIKIGTFKENENQIVLKREALMSIKGKTVYGIFEEDKNENVFAVFKIKNLEEFGTGDFNIEIKSRVVRTAAYKFDEDISIDQIEKIEEFLEPTNYIESDDPDLKVKTEIEFKSESFLDTLVDVVSWVNKNIEYDKNNYVYITNSARKTYIERKGVCDEFSLLTAAFLRIKKIPTKYVVGVTTDMNSSGNHAWLKAYGNRWYYLDPTYNQVIFLDAGHLEISEAEDPSKIKDFIVKTKTKYKIDIYVKHEDPEVQINSYEKFSKMVNFVIGASTRPKKWEDAKISVIVKNISNENIVIPFTFLIHEDFEIKDNFKKNVWLKENEEKTVEWLIKNTVEIILPLNYLYKYKYFVVTPDQNQAGIIEILPGPKEEYIRIKDVSTITDYDQNVVSIYLKYENTFDAVKKATIEVYFNFKLTKKEDIELLPDYNYIKIEINNPPNKYFGFYEIYITYENEKEKYSFYLWPKLPRIKEFILPTIEMPDIEDGNTYSDNNEQITDENYINDKNDDETDILNEKNNNTETYEEVEDSYEDTSNKENGDELITRYFIYSIFIISTILFLAAIAFLVLKRVNY